MATNPRLADLKRTLYMYRKNYFHDNAQIMDYMNNIDDIYNGTLFEKQLKSLLSMSDIYFGNNPNNSSFLTFKKTHKLLSHLATAIKHIVDNDDTNYTTYKSLKMISFSNSTLTTTIEDVSYSVNNNTLVLPINLVNSNMSIDITNMIEYDKNNNINSYLKNHFYFLTKFQTFNLKSQVYAFKYFMDIVKEFIVFFENSQKLLNNNYLNNQQHKEQMCNYFENTMSVDLINKRTNIDNLINKITTDDNNNTLLGETEYTINGDNCNIILKATINQDISLKSNNPDYFVCKIGDKYYNIFSITNTRIEGNYNGNFEINIKLKAYKSLCSEKSRFTNDYSLFNENDNTVRAILLYKTLNDVRKQYINTGKDLRKLNLDIMNSKNKINYIAEKSKNKTELYNSLNIRLIVSIVVAVTIVIIYIISYFMKDDNIKLYGTIFSFVIAIIINIVNMYLNKSNNVELFDNELRCASFTSRSSQISKIQFINNNTMIFMNYIFDLLMSYQSHIASLDTTDLFNKISKSLNSEKKAFIEYDKLYKKQIDNDNNTIDIINHDLIFKTAVINFTSSLILLISMVMLLIFIEPKYIRIYIWTFMFLVIYIIAVFYYVIIRKVNTKSDNNYWNDISDSLKYQL